MGGTEVFCISGVLINVFYFRNAANKATQFRCCFTKATTTNAFFLCYNGCQGCTTNTNSLSIYARDSNVKDKWANS